MTRSRSISTLALFALGSVHASHAQNCAQTSVGLTPINDLSTSLYQGFQGGLYPGGSNVRPLAHTIAGLAQTTQIVPRDATGAPAANGKIVFLSIGMSNCMQEFQAFMSLANADAQRNPRVQLVDGAQGGQTAAIIADPTANFWTVVSQRLTNSNATAAQVQAIWFKEADANPTSGFPAAAQTLESEFVAIMQLLRTKFPNVRECFLASRIYAGYATSSLNPEPYAYEQGFSIKWLVESQIDGDAALNFDAAHGTVVAPWIDWGTYNWADGLTPRSDGLTWLCTDYVSDGTHPSAQGRAKVADILLDFVHTEPTAASWYLAHPHPFAYGTGKTTSIQTVPEMAWAGSPSLGANNFQVGVQHGLPSVPGILFYGGLPASTPFFLGQLYVATPLTRMPVHAFNGAGLATWSIAIDASMVGQTRFYQGYLRDPQNPDGTSVVVSNALRVVFTN